MAKGKKWVQLEMFGEDYYESHELYNADIHAGDESARNRALNAFKRNIKARWHNLLKHYVS